MSSIQDVKRALQSILKDHSPSSIINEGCVEVFHDFFAKCTHEEIIQFIPPTFQQPSNTVLCPQGHSRLIEQPINITLLTPESFINHQDTQVKSSKKQQDTHCSLNAWKLIESIREVVHKDLLEPEFYGSLWDDGKEPQCQSITDPFHRYQALQQIIDVGAETETKCIYRQRIAHLLGAHELEVIDRSVSDSELSKGVTRRSLAIDKLSKSLGKKKDQIIIDNRRRCHYLSFYFEIGPGAIPLLGDSSNKNLVLEYVRNYLPSWVLLCEKIHSEVAASILKGLRMTGWDGESHYNTDFMKHLGRFIDLDMFQKLGEFRPVLVKKTTTAKRKQDGNPAQGPSNKRQSRSSPPDRAGGSPDGIQNSVPPDNSCEPRGTCSRPECGPYPQALVADGSSRSELATVSGQSEMASETDTPPLSSIKTSILPTTGPAETSKRANTPDQNLSMNNLDIDWNLEILWSETHLPIQHAQERYQPENLDTGWAKPGGTGYTPENLDFDWEKLQDFVNLSENLDHGWLQTPQEDLNRI